MLGGTLEGDGERIVRGAATLEAAQADQVSFLANKRYERHVAETRAAAVLVATDYNGAVASGSALIRCDDPYFAFRQAMVALHGFRKPHFDGIDPRADVHETARLAEGVRVAAFVSIGPGCEIGAGTSLYPGVCIGPDTRIGRDCTLYSNVTIYEKCVLGDRVTIHASSSIGHDGFGYATHGTPPVHEKIPQAGWVELEDDVEIGACCAIDRATMGATIVGAGTKFSNLVAIGHGTHLGKHCLLVAQAGLAGSVMVGDYCVFAGQTGIVGHISIGDGVRVAAKSGVTSDVPAGLEIGGAPAVPLPEARRTWMSLSRLPQMRSAIKKLTRELAAIKKKLGMVDSDHDADETERP